MAITKRNAAVCLAAVAAVAAAGGTQVAGAATQHSARSAQATHDARHATETVLSGATAASVRAAILAKLPGATIQRTSTESDGKSTDAYEAHVTRSDGTRVEVLLNSAFDVTAVNADRGHGRRHQRGRGHHGSAEAALTGGTLTQVSAAVLAAFPGSTVDRASTENDGKSTDAYEVHITKADGTRGEVFLNSSYEVTSSK